MVDKRIRNGEEAADRSVSDPQGSVSVVSCVTNVTIDSLRSSKA